ncbi:MAG: tetratricopeptide repeat protein, partial [Planctomycetaceae bacterium]
TEATWMLARLKERRLQWTQALPLYLEVPTDHERGLAAQVAVARCYEAILDRLRELDADAAAWEQDALEKLGGFIKTFPAEPAALSVTQSELSLRLARLELNHRPPRYAHADALLVRAAESLASHVEGREETSAVAASLLKTVRQLRIVSLAGQGRIVEAQALIPSLSGTAPEDLLGLLGGLTQLAERSPDDYRRRELGQLQLDTALELDAKRDGLSDAQRRQLDLCLARAYTATDQVEQAAEVYQRLLKQAPEDRTLLRALAEQLMDCGSPECLSEAKTHWRRLESLEEPGTRLWLLARYHVARCCYLLEQYDECRKLLGLTRVLYPKLGGDDLRQRFESLERDLKLAR